MGEPQEQRAAPLSDEQIVNDLRLYERRGYGWTGEAADAIERLTDALEQAETRADESRKTIAKLFERANLLMDERNDAQEWNVRLHTALAAVIATERRCLDIDDRRMDATAKNDQLMASYEDRADAFGTAHALVAEFLRVHPTGTDEK